MEDDVLLALQNVITVLGDSLDDLDVLQHRAAAEIISLAKFLLGEDD